MSGRGVRKITSSRDIWPICCKSYGVFRQKRLSFSYKSFGTLLPEHVVRSGKSGLEMCAFYGRQHQSDSYAPTLRRTCQDYKSIPFSLPGRRQRYPVQALDAAPN